MSNSSAEFVGRYIGLGASSLDFGQSAPVVVGMQHLGLYATIGAIVLAVWLYQSLQASRARSVQVPHFKASIFKWYFSAETLVRESYLKVR